MAERRSKNQYAHLTDIQTRLMDNDAYGHINNVVYYSYFDTAVNGYLISEGALDLNDSAVIGLVVETSCQYFKPLKFPQKITVGIAASKIGNSSVIYQIGIFAEGEEEPAAEGHFVHVYVDRDTNTPTVLPVKLRTAVEAISKT